MPRLPVISGSVAVRIFLKLGYEIDHQTGSHIIMRQRDKPHRRLTIPNHPELAKGTLRAIIRESGLTREQFLGICR
jgi:predicted RNA binding protein YcfA (HicA-like mRNA interferase family)